MTFAEKQRRAVECGYAREEALAEAAKLGVAELRLLAAMAITHHDAVVSDRQRDLDRGVKLVLGREPYWWTV